MNGVRSPKVEAVGSVAADLVFWQMGGRLHLTVVAKAAFRLVPEAPMTTLPPEPIHRADLHHGGQATRSARVTNDLAPFRHKADVLLSGNAQLGEDAGATVRLAVLRGDKTLLDKRVHIVVDLGTTGNTVVPLVYERAYGGPDFPENPAGTGRAPGSPAPALMDPSDPHEAVGFGPIGSAWPARARLLPTATREHIDRTLASPRRENVDAPVLELPDGFDWAYFQAAPADQRIDFLQGDEWIAVDGAVPKAPQLRSRLPQVRGIVRAEGLAPAPQEIPLEADGLHVDAERRIVTVVFRGLVPVPDAAALAKARLLVAVASGGEPVAWPAERAARPFEGTLQIGDDAPASAHMPFKPGATPTFSSTPPSRPSTVAERPAGWSTVAEARSSARAAFTSTMPMIDAAKPDALPFSTKHPNVAPPPLHAEQAQGDRAVRVAPLPVASASRAPAIVDAPPPRVPFADPGDPTANYKPTEAEQAMNAAAEAPAPGPDVKASRFFHHLGGKPQEVQPGAEPPAPERAPDQPPARVGEIVPFLVDGVRGRGPLAVASIPWEIKAGKMSLTVVAKATCDIVAGGAARVRPMAAAATGDAHVDGNATHSLTYASDFVVFKPRADVLLTGYAYAADPASGKGAVRFAFGHPQEPGALGSPKAFDRVFAVYGARSWERTLGGWTATQPERWEHVRVAYEGAFGGPGFEANPVGIGFPFKPGEARPPLPLFEESGHAISAPTDAPPPVAFAGIPQLWRQRWSKAGTFDEKWRKDRWPYLPEDASLQYFQAAPPLQQVDYPVGDERFSISGMHPSLPVIEGTLPKVRARIFARRTPQAGGGLDELTVRLDTVQFDVDAMTVTLCWRGLYDVSADDAPEIGVLFLTLEPLSDEPLSLDAVKARLARALEQPMQASQVAEDAAARFEKPRDERRAAAAKQAQVVREMDDEGRALYDGAVDKLKAQGVVGPDLERAQAASRSSAAPKPDYDAVGARLRAAGMTPGDVDKITSQMKEGVPKPPPSPRQAAKDETNDQKRARVQKALAEKRALDGAELSGADLSGIDFTGASLVRAQLKDTSLRGCTFKGARLSGASFARADATDAVFDAAVCDLTDFGGATIEGASFVGARLDHTDLGGAKGARAVFRDVSGRGARFNRGDWSQANFARMEMPAADFSGAKLDQAVFDGASLTDVRLHHAEGERASFKDARMPGARADGSKFPKTNFKGVHAPASIWNRALLDHASFAGGHLARASFFASACRHTNLSGADLVEARFDRAELHGAVVSKSNLMNGSLQQADASDSDFRGASLYGVNMWKTRLDRALLENVLVDRRPGGEK